MSAIWGIVSRKELNNPMTVNLGNHVKLNMDESGEAHVSLDERFEKMTKAMEQYRLDRTDALGFDNYKVACGHQYFTPESIFDVSPVYDEEKKEYFAADCFLYNRDDVIRMLENAGNGSDEASIDSEKAANGSEETSIDSEEASGASEKRGYYFEKIGDAQLAYLLYKKQGLSFVENLRGSFAVAIFEEQSGKLQLFTDHFCKRYLAYHIADDYIAFASCYKPLLEVENHEYKLSKHFIINAFSTMTPLNFRESDITPFEGIFHLGPAIHVTIDVKTGSIKKHQYWQPRKNVKKLKGLKDEEFKELFLEEYRKVCIAHLRSRKETGIMLSGGLDSASVLAMVAPALRDQGKKIFSYTTVPCKDFKPAINYSVIEDESFLIWEQQKYQPNLEPRFIDGNGENCLSAVPKLQEMYDLPVKAVINGNNVLTMGEAAVADDCLILLGGGNGNATVSYGYISNYVGLCLEKFKIATAIRETSMYCRKVGTPRKRMLKDFIKDMRGYFFETRNVGQYFINKENRKKYGIDKLMNMEKKELGTAFFCTESRKRNFMFIPIQYIQKSLYYTLNSLTQGYLQLDPTFFVEMVELCMSLPNECFVKDGVERRLIRDYMKDLMPPVITDMRKGYGVQASDFQFRINRDWDQIKDQVMGMLTDPEIYEYLDKAEVEELISDIKANEHNFGWNTAWFTVNICSLGYFLRGHKRYLGKG